MFESEGYDRKDLSLPNNQLSLISWYLIAILYGFLPGKNEQEYSIILHCLAALFLFISSIIINIGYRNKMYQNEIKKSLFPNLLKVFDKGIIYKFYTIKQDLFNASELFKKEVNSISFDDYFGGTYNGVKFCVAEADLANVVKRKKQKPETTKLFTGIVMRFKMNKNINSRVIICSKSLFNRVPKGYEKVELEYEIEIPDEDVEMVANSAGVSEDEARQALEECKGDLAEAIMKLNQ